MKGAFLIPLFTAIVGCSTPALRVDVMSFNIRYGSAPDGANAWDHRRGLVIGVIGDRGADFVGVQESEGFQTRELAAALPGYGHVGRSRLADDPEGESTPIFYRRDRWRVAESGTFWLSDTPNVPGSRSWGNELPRIVTWARFVEKRSGRGVYLFNTHFDNQSQPARERSAELLVERIAARGHGGDPVLVTGDFNADERNPAVRTILASGLVDTFRALHGETAGVGTLGGFTGRTDGPRIDYVFASPAAIVESAAILRDHTDGRYPSDHFPVTATLAFPAQ